MAGTVYLVHCTSVERARAIATEGLLPGTEHRTNYEDMRWMPLDGVYLSNSPRQIAEYRRVHGLEDHGLVLVEADPDALLPDEDVIEIQLGLALQSIGGRPWAEMADSDDEMPPADHPMWASLREAFLKRAGPRSVAPLRETDMDDLVDWWASYCFDGGEGVDPWEWAALKDRVVRAFPSMEGRLPGEGSKRHPGPIGFDGPTRIVAVVVSSGGLATVERGTIPKGMRDVVAGFLGDDVDMETGGTA